MMTKEEREAIRARCDAATPGPWKKKKLLGIMGAVISKMGTNETYCVVDDTRLNDADFIAHTRQDIPALLDALDETETDRNQWKAQAEANAAAKRTLELAGYTYHGGELWKPPLGKKTDFNLVDRYKAQVETLKSVMRDSENPCEFCKYSRDDNTPDNVCDDREDDNPCLECTENGGDTECWQFDEVNFRGGGK